MKKLIFIVVCAIAFGVTLHEMKKKHPVAYDFVVNISSKTMHEVGAWISSVDWKGATNKVYDATTGWCANIYDWTINKCSTADKKVSNELHSTCNKAEEIAKESLLSSVSHETLYDIKYHIVQSDCVSHVEAQSLGKPKVTRKGKEYTLRFNLPDGTPYIISTDHTIAVDKIEEHKID